MNSYTEITRCRVCGNNQLEAVVQLGQQQLTGVFPKTKEEKISSGPLTLVKCRKDNEQNHCGLLQLKHTFNDQEMYCQTYGYRSGLNRSMVRHLSEIAEEVMNRVKPGPGDLIIDIGSNDATLLRFFETTGATLVGVDPGGEKFSKYYSDRITLVPDFFPSAALKKITGEKKAKAITSIAMFYDLDEPLSFMKEIAGILDDKGIWVFEQSYLPDMLQTNSYDTICHEHKEYYALAQIKWMTDKAGLTILDVSRNDTNGGSFRITVSKKLPVQPEKISVVAKMLEEERALGLDEMEVYHQFEKKIQSLKTGLTKLVNAFNQNGKKIFGYGASTKGNVMLQYCGFTSKDIPFIAEVNEDKWGSLTPSTHIPIISEKEAKRMKPDYFLVLPWHFRDFILEKESDFRAGGGKFIFPFPEVEVTY